MAPIRTVGTLILAGAIVALGCPAASPSAGQPPERANVHIDDGTIDGSIIKEYDNVWMMTIHYADGRVVERGLSTDHVRMRQVDGKRYMTRTEATASVVGKTDSMPSSNYSMTFNVFDPITMRPLVGESYSSSGGPEIRHFAGKHVTTTTRQLGAPDRTIETDTAEEVFDVHGGMTGLLIAALPLKAGYRTNLPGIGDAGFDTTAVRVLREESIPGGHLGRLKTWVVEVDEGSSTSTYWVQKSPPYVIRVTVNAINAFASWDIIP
jgi:hypothetical protein